MYRVSLQRKEIVHLDTKLVVHAYRSPTRTRGIVFCFIFTAHQSGPYRIDRTSEDPIIQDSLKHRHPQIGKPSDEGGVLKRR